MTKGPDYFSRWTTDPTSESNQEFVFPQISLLHSRVQRFSTLGTNLEKRLQAVVIFTFKCHAIVIITFRCHAVVIVTSKSHAVVIFASKCLATVFLLLLDVML